MNPVNDELSEVVKALEAAPYRFATTMPATPHHYTLKREWRDPHRFVEVVRSMRKFERMEFYAPWGKENPYLFANGYRYWTMGASEEETCLINRNVFHHDSAFYNGMASDYDARFSDAKSVRESRREFGSLPLKKGDRILDIGCGTGMLIDYRWTSLPLIDEHGVIIAGHGRVEAGIKAGLIEAPCMVVEGWSEEKKQAFALADNHIAGMSDWDIPTLGKEIDYLKEFDVTIDNLDFDFSAFIDAENSARVESKSVREKGQRDTVHGHVGETDVGDLVTVNCPHCGKEMDIL